MTNVRWIAFRNMLGVFTLFCFSGLLNSPEVYGNCSEKDFVAAVHATLLEESPESIKASIEGYQKRIQELAKDRKRLNQGGLTRKELDYIRKREGAGYVNKDGTITYLSDKGVSKIYSNLLGLEMWKNDQSIRRLNASRMLIEAGYTKPEPWRIKLIANLTKIRSPFFRDNLGRGNYVIEYPTYDAKELKGIFSAFEIMSKSRNKIRGDPNPSEDEAVVKALTGGGLSPKVVSDYLDALHNEAFDLVNIQRLMTIAGNPEDPDAIKAQAYMDYMNEHVKFLEKKLAKMTKTIEKEYGDDPPPYILGDLSPLEMEIGLLKGEMKTSQAERTDCCQRGNCSNCPVSNYWRNKIDNDSEAADGVPLNRSNQAVPPPVTLKLYQR